MSDREKEQVIEDVEVELCNLFDSEDADFDTKSVNIDEPAVKKRRTILMSQLLGDVFSKSADELDQLHQRDKARRELTQ